MKKITTTLVFIFFICSNALAADSGRERHITKNLGPVSGYEPDQRGIKKIPHRPRRRTAKPRPTFEKRRDTDKFKSFQSLVSGYEPDQRGIKKIRHRSKLQPAEPVPTFKRGRDKDKPRKFRSPRRPSDRLQSNQKAKTGAFGVWSKRQKFRDTLKTDPRLRKPHAKSPIRDGATGPTRINKQDVQGDARPKYGSENSKGPAPNPRKTAMESEGRIGSRGAAPSSPVRSDRAIGIKYDRERDALIYPEKTRIRGMGPSKSRGYPNDKSHGVRAHFMKPQSSHEEGMPKFGQKGEAEFPDGTYVSPGADVERIGDVTTIYDRASGTSITFGGGKSWYEQGAPKIGETGGREYSDGMYAGPGTEVVRGDGKTTITDPESGVSVTFSHDTRNSTYETGKPKDDKSDEGSDSNGGKGDSSDDKSSNNKGSDDSSDKNESDEKGSDDSDSDTSEKDGDSEDNDEDDGGGSDKLYGDGGTGDSNRAAPTREQWLARLTGDDRAPERPGDCNDDEKSGSVPRPGDPEVSSAGCRDDISDPRPDPGDSSPPPLTISTPAETHTPPGESDDKVTDCFDPAGCGGPGTSSGRLHRLNWVTDPPITF